jgi:hypothetical protein
MFSDILLHTQENRVSSSQGVSVKHVGRSDLDEVREQTSAQGVEGSHQDDLFTRQLEAELSGASLDAALRQNINANQNNIEKHIGIRQVVKEERHAETSITQVTQSKENQSLEAQLVQEARQGNSREEEEIAEDDRAEEDREVVEQREEDTESTLVRVGTAEHHLVLGSEASSSASGADVPNGNGDYDFNNNVQEVEQLSEKFDDLYASVNRGREREIETKPGVTSIFVTVDDDRFSNVSYTHKEMTDSTENLLLATQPYMQQPLRYHDSVSSAGMMSHREGDRVISKEPADDRVFARHRYDSRDSRSTRSELSSCGDRVYGTALVHNGKAAVDYGTMERHGKVPTFYSMTDLCSPRHHQPPVHHYQRTQRTVEHRRMRRSEGSAQYHSQTMNPSITRIHCNSVSSGYEPEPRHYSASTLDNAELHKSNVFLAPEHDHIDAPVVGYSQNQTMHTVAHDPRRERRVKSEQRQYSELRVETSKQYAVQEHRKGKNGDIYDNGTLHISLNDGERSNVWSPVSQSTSRSTASMTSPGPYSPGPYSPYSDDSNDYDPRYSNGYYDERKPSPREIQEQISPKNQGRVYQKGPRREDTHPPRTEPQRINARKKQPAYNQRPQGRPSRTRSSYQESPIAIEEEEFDVPDHMMRNFAAKQRSQPRRKNQPRNSYPSYEGSESDDDVDNNVVIEEELNNKVSLSRRR